MTLDPITRDEYRLITLARIFALARRGEIPDKMRGGWPIRLVSSKRRSGHIIARSWEVCLRSPFFRLSVSTMPSRRRLKVRARLAIVSRQICRAAQVIVKCHRRLLLADYDSTIRGGIMRSFWEFWSLGAAGRGLLSDFRASKFRCEISSRVVQRLPRVEPMNRFKE